MEMRQHLINIRGWLLFAAKQELMKMDKLLLKMIIKKLKMMILKMLNLILKMNYTISMIKDKMLLK